METEAGEPRARPQTAILDRLSAAVGSADGIDESRLRLGIAIVLSFGGIYFFRLEAAQALGASLVGGVLVLAVLYAGHHQVGLRGFSRVWPGVARGLGTALLVACLCPPGLPIGLLGALGAGAVLIEGLQRRLGTPVALSGVLVAWAVAWLWWYRTGLPLLAPFSLRPLDEPIVLWTKFQLAVDPLRLYAGNVAGALGATSFGLASVGVIVLGYGRRVSWLYLAAFVVPPAAALAISRQPLTVYLICGQAAVLAGIVAAETSRLPEAWNFRVAAGLAAGAISAILLVRGLGSPAYGIGVLSAAVMLTGLQIFDVLGARTSGAASTLDTSRPSAAAAGMVSSPAAGNVPSWQLALLVLIPPVGLFLLWRNESLPVSQRINLVALGSLLYGAALAGSLAWLWLLRLPT